MIYDTLIAPFADFEFMRRALVVRSHWRWVRLRSACS